MPATLPPYATTADYTPINAVVAVTPSDSTDLQAFGGAMTCRAFYANGAGTVAYQDAQGSAATLSIGSNGVGQLVWIRAKRILATGTSATGIFACY